MKNAIQLLEVHQIGKAALQLADAFMEDPLQSYVFPDPIERQSKSPAHFAAILQYGCMFGEVYTTENLEAAIVWLRPGETNITPDKATMSGLDLLPEILGEEATNRFFSVMDYLDPYHAYDVPEPHWYAMVLGVAPGSQGKGIGRSLLEPVLQEARINNQAVYLETAQPSNIAFYEKLGFSVIRELTESVSGLHLWTFKVKS